MLSKSKASPCIVTLILSFILSDYIYKTKDCKLKPCIVTLILSFILSDYIYKTKDCKLKICIYIRVSEVIECLRSPQIWGVN